MMNRQRTAALLASIAATATMTLMSAQPSLADNFIEGPWLIENADQLCVSLNPLDFGKDVQVVQEPCDARPEEQWLVVPAGGNSNVYQIVNQYTGMCLRAVSNRDFGAVDTIDCTSISNERWFVGSGAIVSQIS